MLDEVRDRTAPDLDPLAFIRDVEVDEHAAREALRRQIAKLERDLAHALAELRPGDERPDPLRPRRRGPRLLSLGELERVRDGQADRLAALRAEIGQRADREAEKRVLLEKMLLEPGRYRFVRISQAELGERGCGAYHVRPRLGIIGMLAGWWHVKVSSGCPLPEPRPSRGPGGGERDQAAASRVPGRGRAGRNSTGRPARPSARARR